MNVQAAKNPVTGISKYADNPVNIPKPNVINRFKKNAELVFIMLSVKMNKDMIMLYYHVFI
jgi:hypothetical protein